MIKSDEKSLIKSYRIFQNHLGHERGSRFMFQNIQIIERHHRRIDPILNIVKTYMGNDGNKFIEANPLIFIMDHKKMEANFKKIHEKYGKMQGNAFISKYPFILEYNERDIELITRNQKLLRRKR